MRFSPLKGLCFVIFSVVGLLHRPAHAQLVFDLADGTSLAALATTDNALYLKVRGGFQAAADRWSARLTDAVTIRLTIDYAPLIPGRIGEAGSEYVFPTYSQTRGALAADVRSADDALAVASLPIGSSVSLLLNYTSNSPNGVGSPTPYVDNDGDANNANTLITRANAKALGLIGASAAAEDAHITFSSNFDFDFDPTNGVNGTSIDFIGIATHEIGHALGFTSGVDILDQNSSGTFHQDDEFTFVTPMDLFRYSADSLVAGVRDWTADARSKYFSLDGGTTSLGLFATGVVHGDGWQATHWKDNARMGIMDPSAAFGETLHIRTRDLKAMDAIGWDLAASAPEPVSVALLAVGIIAGCSLRRRIRLQ